uniref:Probable ATP-dependent RNA helicase DDX46 n=1 Tax=Ascaris lumbricoides TaxID=6252 RepID=A0A0M3I4P4_ASCLU
MGNERHSSKSHRERDAKRRSRSKSPKHEKNRRDRSRSPRDRRDRDRNKSPRGKDRGRSPDHSKERAKGRDKDRSRSRERKDKKKEREKKKDKDLDLAEIVSMTDKDEAERKLEIEMQKRRERIERWRQERKKKEEGEETKVNEEDIKERKWTLDNEEDDDEIPPTEQTEIKEEKKEEEDEIDPLDAYMSEVNKEVRATKYGSDQAGESKARIVVIKTETGIEPNKGEIIEAEDEMEAGESKARIVVIKTETGIEPNKGEIIEAEDEMEQVVDDFDIEKAASSLIARGRQLPQTDHSKVYYRPFRKDFYVETAELAKMTKKEVDQYREELDIRVRGKNCPKPVRSWAQCGVEWKILNTLKKLEYTKPTAIQAQAIPAIMSGRDVIGIAKTGSGKTLAFLLPMFRHIMDQPELEELDGPIAVIMSPTRELAMQTWKEANKFAKPLNIRVACVYGGVGISDQIGDLKRGAEVIVCTVGRLTDMLAANKGKVTNLRRVTYLVLDEADRMFDMGFEPQVMKIVNNIRPDRQTVLFSATFPRQMEALARKILDKPVEILVGGKSVVCDDVSQNVVILEEHQKMLKLLELLGVYWEHGNVLVFVDKQEKADELVAQLMRSGYNCAPLHGGIDQFDRDSTILDFKAAKIKLLVATSVAARGLDVKKLILVVNYDCPNHYEDYVHRVGRTGRAGNKGYAYTFILPHGQERMAGEVCRAFETASKEPPEQLKKIWEDYKAQMAAEGKTVHMGGCGFSGSGYKYDQAEDEKEATRRKVTRLVHGMESAMDDDDDDEIEQQLSSMMKGKRRVIEGHGPSTNAPNATAVGDKLEKVCRAFETASKEPPEQLKKIWEDYKAQMAAEGKTVHMGGCGFSGSGYKYDQAEDEKEATRRKVTRLVHGMESAMDDDDDDEIEQQLSSMMKGKRRVIEGHGPSTNAPNATAVGDKLEKAKAAFAKIAEAKQLGATVPVEKDAASLTAEAVMRGGEAVPITLSAKSIAKQKAEQLNERLNYMPSELLPGVETETELQYFEEELEINDFPQQIRYRICSRDSLAQVQEYADVGISVKGSYYPSNKEPKNGERKLFLFLEARSEIALRRAREEILRIMKDAFRQMMQMGARNAGTGGRYKLF